MRDRSLRKNKIGIARRRLQSAIERLHRRFVFLAIWLDDDRQELPRRGLQFRFDQLRGIAESFHLVDLFRRELQAELFESQHQVQVLD